MLDIELPPPPPSPEALRVITGPGLQDILRERIEQIDVHGFGLAHDLGHHPGDLSSASISYLNTAHDQLHGTDYPPTEHPDTWPWEREAWKPGDARANLVKGIAIAWAVLDRLDADAAAAPAGAAV